MIDQTGEHGGEEGHEPWDDAAQAAPEDHAAAFGSAAHEPEALDLGHDRLALGEDDRLPWLDSADDVDHQAPDSGRMAGFVMLGLLALGALIGGIYWVSHSQTPAAQADGSLIEASKAPYKVEPANPGGKTFEGTGDSSYQVSEGKHPDGSAGPATADAKAADAKAAADAKSGEGNAASTKTAEAKPAEAKSVTAKPTAVAAAAQGGVGVQVGAFSSHTAAEAAWGKLSGQYSALSGHGHRIVEGKADIGTVYRLQALAGDAGAAKALCGALQGAGLHCQVKP
jgi:cell division septation protein DedD